MKRLIIDVREPEEFAHSHVPGAINIPPANLMGDLHELAEIPKDTELVLYCRSGSRSHVASHILRTRGFTNIVNGINEQHVRMTYSDKQ